MYKTHSFFIYLGKSICTFIHCVPLQGSDVFLEMLASCLHPHLDIGSGGKQHHWDIQEATSCHDSEAQKQKDK